MTKLILTVLAAVITYTLSGCGQLMPSATSTGSQALSARSAAPQELLVKFKTPVNASSIQIFHAQHGTRTLRVIPGLNVHVMVLTTRQPMAQVLAKMNQSPMVEYAEPNRGISLNDDQPTL